MKEDDFSAFKKSMEAPRSFPVDEARWAALQTRLEYSGKRAKGGAAAFWWAVTAALPFMLLCMLLWSGWSDSRRANRQLIEQLELLVQQQDELRSVTSEYATDTIYIERVIYRDRTDLPDAVFPGQALIYRPGSSEYPGRLLSESYRPLSDMIAQGVPMRTPTLPAISHTDIGHSKSTRVPIVSSLSSLPILYCLRQWPDRPISPDLIRGELPATPVAAMPDLRKPFHPWRIIRLDQLAPESAVGIGTLRDEKLSEAHALQAEVGLRLPVGSRWELVGLLGAWRSHYLLKDFDAALGAPPVEAPAAAYTFTDAKVRQTAFGYRLGVRYRWATTSRWAPFTTVLYERRYMRERQTYYDFAAGDMELTAEREEMMLPAPASFLQLRAGAWYVWPRRSWRLGINAYYARPISSAGPFVPEFGLMSRLQVEF